MYTAMSQRHKMCWVLLVSSSECMYKHNYSFKGCDNVRNISQVRENETLFLQTFKCSSKSMYTSLNLETSKFVWILLILALHQIFWLRTHLSKVEMYKYTPQYAFKSPFPDWQKPIKRETFCSQSVRKRTSESIKT